jgi:hypothetical protein
MTGELNQAVHNKPTGRSASGLQSPGSAPTKKKKNKVIEANEYEMLLHFHMGCCASFLIH